MVAIMVIHTYSNWLKFLCFSILAKLMMFYGAIYDWIVTSILRNDLIKLADQYFMIVTITEGHQSSQIMCPHISLWLCNPIVLPQIGYADQVFEPGNATDLKPPTVQCKLRKLIFLQATTAVHTDWPCLINWHFASMQLQCTPKRS